MKNKLSTLAITAVCVLSLGLINPINDADAKSFSSRARSISSSGFSISRSVVRTTPSSTGSLFKSTPKTNTIAAKPKDSKPVTGFYSNPPSDKQKSIKTNTGTSSITTAAKTQNTKKMLTIKKQQEAFKKAPVVPGTSVGSAPGSSRKAYTEKYSANPIYSSAKRYDYNTYPSRYTSYYGSYTPPVYVYNTSPSFGLLDTIFLFHILNDNDQASQFAYNHQYDSDYIAWRREADRLAMDNADLRKQLETIDSKTALMTGVRDTSYVPKGVDADLMLAAGARDTLIPEMKLCVGSRSGAYFTVGAGVIAPRLETVNLTTVETEGAGQAIDYVSTGKCDAAIVQGDSYWNYIETHQTTHLPFERADSLFREAVLLICTEKGPTEISDLTDKDQVWFPAGSGAAETWKNFIGEDKSYNKIKTVLNTPSMVVKSNEEALLKVNNKHSCMMYVGAPGSTKFMRSVETMAKSNKLVLIDIDDGALDNTTDPEGKDVYQSEQVDSSVYPNLSRQAGVIYGDGDIDTLTMDADLIISEAWKDKNQKAFNDVVFKVRELKDNIHTMLKQ